MSDNETLEAIKNKIHFTYKESINSSSLCQGDLLKITDDLKSVFEKIHPYFLNEQYKYFMVLTQSCDLVIRDTKCKTPYITLAAVKSFDDFFENLLVKNKLAEKVNGFILVDDKNYSRAYQLLERLYNNTENDYFFLYKDTTLGLEESMVASLKVSIALKSDLHYDVCLAAKVLELSDEFKAKLGWLVGNIYSRVGTTDWESIKTKKERDEMLSKELKTHCITGEKTKIKALKKELENNAEKIKTVEDAISFLDSYNIASTYDQVISILEEIINSSSKKIPEKEKELLLAAIRSRVKLKTLLSK